MGAKRPSGNFYDGGAGRDTLVGTGVDDSFMALDGELGSWATSGTAPRTSITAATNAIRSRTCYSHEVRRDEVVKEI